MEAKITSKGQMTLPKEARQHLRVKPGDKVRLFIDPEGHVVLLPVMSVIALKGMVKSRRRRPPTVEEIDEAVRSAVSERYKRATGK